jgi:exodeoxyribonuclease V alpha subunit
MTKLDLTHLNELLAKARLAREQKLSAERYDPSKLPSPECSTLCHQLEPCSITESGECDVLSDLPISPPIPSHAQTLDRYGNLITLNEAQSSFVSLTSTGKSAVLIGAAGTGKTTTQRTVTEALILSGLAGVLQAGGHKHLISGTPGIVICAYTRRAVANIRKNVPDNLQSNCITIHKLLEYQPIFYDIQDQVSGETKTTMRFEATRTPANPLPHTIRVLIFEESSMLGLDLYREVIAACPHNPQLIFLGDIQQLPPVFGPAILGFKLTELPTIELTEVYRQALESPIISLAHRVLSGTPIPVSELPSWNRPGQLTIRPWKKRIESINACLVISRVFCELEEAGHYDPEEDMILIPFNKAFGTDEVNKRIANHLAKKNKSVVHQIVAGFQRVYFREGEKVLYDKEDAVILRIETNPAYYGTKPLDASPTLDYWGYDSAWDSPDATRPKKEAADIDVDFVLSQMAQEQSGDRVKSASHLITLQMVDSEQEITISSAGDINSLIYGYALTVHKAQGSEWRRVFLCFHQSHATMLQRELLYTAITRAREELIIFCEPDTFEKGILSQKVKGDTLAEKAEWFKGKKERTES